MTKRKMRETAKRTRTSRAGAIRRMSGVNNEDEKWQQQQGG